MMKLPPYPAEAEEEEHEEKLLSWMKIVPKMSQTHQRGTPLHPGETCLGGLPGRHETVQTGRIEKEENEDE